MEWPIVTYHYADTILGGRAFKSWRTHEKQIQNKLIRIEKKLSRVVLMTGLYLLLYSKEKIQCTS